VDVLLVVTDPTVRGVRTAQGIVQLASELQINIGRSLLVVNRVAGDLPPALQQAIGELGIPLAAALPADPAVGEFDATGQPLVNLPPGSPIVVAVENLLQELIRVPVV
jgi:CO dehydrogenase maturation factor